MEPEVAEKLKEAFDQVYTDVVTKMDRGRNDHGITEALSGLQRDIPGEIADEIRDIIGWSIMELVKRELNRQDLPWNRLHQDVQPKRIAIDFDGVIVEEGHYPKIGPLIPGAKEAIQKLYNAGWYIVIWSARASPGYGEDPYDQIQLIEDFLHGNNIRHDRVSRLKKEQVHVTIDDKCIGFRNNWDEVVSLLK